jgi:hypothetical protein
VIYSSPLMNGWFARRGGGCELFDYSGWI